MVELFVLDKNFDIVTVIDDFSSLIWSEKYYDDGTFELHTNLKYVEVLRNNKYISRKDKKNTGVIEEFNYTDKEVFVKGRFLTSVVLESRAIRDTERYTNITAEMFMRNIVAKYCADVTQLGAINNVGTIINKQITGFSVNKGLAELALEQEIGYIVYYDYLQDKVFFEVYKGIDRSINQDQNSWIIASTDFDNIISDQYNQNKKNFKNYAIVAGQVYRRKEYYTDEQGNQRWRWERFRTMEDVDQTNGDDRIELYVDARDIEIEIIGQDEDGDDVMENLDDYLRKLHQRGLEKLAEHKIEENIDADIVYIEKLGLGDKITYKNNLLGLSIDSRVVAIDEVYETGENPIRNITIGKEKLTIKKLIQRSVF